MPKSAMMLSKVQNAPKAKTRGQKQCSVPQSTVHGASAVWHIILQERQLAQKRRSVEWRGYVANAEAMVDEADSAAIDTLR